MRFEVRLVNLDVLSGVTTIGRNCIRRCLRCGSQIRIASGRGPRRGVPLGMHRMNPEHLDSDPSDASLPADIRMREEPEDEEEENEEEENEEEHDFGEEDEDGDEGYSE
jgi:hypothetical protein